jgi:hypothetical protein
MKKQILTVVAAAALLGSVVASAGQDFNVRIHNQTNDTLRATLTNVACMNDTGNLDKLSLAKGDTTQVQLENKNSGSCALKTSAFTLTFYKGGLDTPPIGAVNYASTANGNCTESGRHCFNSTNGKSIPQPVLINGKDIGVDIYVNNP